MNSPQDDPQDKSTWQNMESGGDTTASSEILHKMTLILLSLILSYLKMALMYKKLPMGVQFICPWHKNYIPH